MVIYSVMQSVEEFCSFLSNSSMLLEKSNNYSGTLLFHAAGIVDLWSPLQAVHFAGHPYSDTTMPINTTATITSIAMSQSKSARLSQQTSVFARSRHTYKSRLSCLAAQKAAFYRFISGTKSLAEAYSGRSSSFSRECQTFWTSSLSSRESSSLPICFS